jgi:hypothetical protein
MTELGKYIHDPLVLFVAGALYILGRDFVVHFLRADAKRKLADSDPGNDAGAHAQLAAADAIERLPGPKK